MENEKQATNIRLKCGSCGQPVSSCACATVETASTSVVDNSRTPPLDKSSAQSVPESADSASALGTIVGGKYQLMAELGSGGMGTVFKAKHIGLPKHFAVKILKREFCNNADFRARFEQEAHTLSLLNHPHLVSTYDYGSTEVGEAYLVMDFVDGHSLEDGLKAIRRLEQKTAVDIFIQICEGLIHAHGLGILHRDLKPSNIMLVNSKERSDFVKVVDFGVAKTIATGENVAQIIQSMTKTGQFFGSPFYMSPEQGNRGKVDQRSDIYTMGVLMYECLTSDVPFRGDNFFATMMLQSEAQPNPFEPSLGISPKLEEIVIKALEKNPDNRYQSMEQLRRALSGVFTDDQMGPKSSPKPKHGTISLARAALICGSTLLLCALAVAVYWLAGNTRPERPAPAPAPLAQAKQQLSGQAIVPPKSASPVRLPAIPDSVQIAAGDKDLTAAELVTTGVALAAEHNNDWQDLMPARYFMTALQKDPKYGDAYSKLSSYYWDQRNNAPEDKKAAILQKCLEVYTVRIALDPKNDQLYALRVAILIAMDRPGEALDDASMAIKLNPGDHRLHLAHAQCLNDLNRYREAISEYEKYMTGSDVEYFYSIGSCYQKLKQDQKALDFASRWLGANEQNVGLLLIKADSEYKLKRYKEALKDYLALKPLWPEVVTKRAAEIANCRAGRSSI